MKTASLHFCKTSSVTLLFALACTFGLCSPAAFATTYDVGPGQNYPSINSVPWNILAAGDTVQIHYGIYHEFINVTTRGTAAQPIRIIGISDPVLGQPVIDGKDAVVGPYARFASTFWTPTRGVVSIGPSITPQSPGIKPGYITISNLTVRNANGYTPYNFTDGAGSTHPFGISAAGIYVLLGEHIVIDHCTITANDNGIFVQSGEDSNTRHGTEATESRDITIQYSHIFGNGVPNKDDRHHNVYTEAAGMIFQYNLFGPLVEGSMGNNIKDRSSGTVIRYNSIEGGAHLLDLVDAQGSSDVTAVEPDYQQTYVYGNILLNDTATPSSRMVHYGGDQGQVATDRKGTLYFYNNTVIVHEDQKTLYETQLLQLCDSGLKYCGTYQTADLRNNVFYSVAVTAGAKPAVLDLGSDGVFNIGVNWISPTWQTYRGTTPGSGVYNGIANLIVDAKNNPSFTSLANMNFLPTSNSSLLGRASAPAPAVFANPAAQSYAVTREYVRDQQGKSRALATDLGAMQSNGLNTPSVYWTDPHGITYGTALNAVQLNPTATADGKWTFSPAAGTVLGAGTHDLTATFTPTDALRYAATTATSSITVYPAPLTITVLNATRTTDDINPVFTATYKGFVNGDQLPIGGAPSLTTAATPSSPVGTYPVIANAGTLTSANYYFNFVNGALTVTVPPGQITATYRQGVNGYVGNVIASINNLYTDQTYNPLGNAAYNAVPDTISLRASTAPLNKTVSSEALIKFASLNIPPTAKVRSATITLVFSCFTANGPYLGFYLNGAWDSSAASKLSWANRSLSKPWASPGALGLGFDVLSGSMFSLPSLSTKGDQIVTINLNPAIVQAWVANPSTNNGILLVDAFPGGGDRGVSASSNTAPILANRPMLTIVYR